MKSSPLIVAVLFLVNVTSAWADVTIKTRVKSGGFKGMGAFEGAIVRSVSGEKSRELSDIKYSGALARMMAGAKDAVNVVRVDLDKIWKIVPSKKIYSEQPIRVQMPASTSSGDTPSTSSKQDSPASESKPTHRIKKSEFTVKKTGQAKAINGFSTEEHAVRLLVEVEEIETKQVTTFKAETDLWVTPHTTNLRKAMDEEAKFAQAYLKKAGLAISPSDRQVFNPATLAMMLGVSESAAESTIAQTKKKIESINGFPIVTDSRWFVEEDSHVKAARNQAAKQADTEDDAELDLSGGAAGVAGGLIGGFAKKKMKASQQKRAEEREGLPAFSTYAEISSIEFSPVAASEFEVPAGFKKTKL